MKVEVVETTLVAPSEATPRHALWLSNLDLAVPKTHTPLVYYYPAPTAAGSPDGGGGDRQGGGGNEEGKEGFFSPERLREALARALVPFYPLAGRLAVGPGGRLEIDCNGEGALFVVARADFTGDEMFRDFEPSPEARRLLVPFAASGDPPCVLAMVQQNMGARAHTHRRFLRSVLSPGVRVSLHRDNGTFLPLPGEIFSP